MYLPIQESGPAEGWDAHQFYFNQLTLRSFFEYIFIVKCILVRFRYQSLYRYSLCLPFSTPRTTNNIL